MSKQLTHVEVRTIIGESLRIVLKENDRFIRELMAKAKLANKKKPVAKSKK